MESRALRESITTDLEAQLKKSMIDSALHEKAIQALDDLSADDWKDIDNMSTVEASDMILEIARHK